MASILSNLPPITMYAKMFSLVPGGHVHICFSHTRKAYYSVILESVLGPLLTPAEPRHFIEGTNMDLLRKQKVRVDLAQVTLAAEFSASCPRVAKISLGPC